MRQHRKAASALATDMPGARPLTARELLVRALPFAVLLVAVSMAVWWPCLSFRFIYDDHSQIENNPRIQSAEHLGQLLTEPFWAQLGANRASHYYRPVFSLLYLSEYLFFGPDPASWHAVNLGLHIAVALSVFLLLLLLFREVLAAFLASIVFAVLPANAEVVSFLGAADDSLFAMLVLLSLCAMMAGNRVASRQWRLCLLLVSGLLFLLSVFTKETALGAGLILISYQLIAAQRTQTRSRRDRHEVIQRGTSGSAVFAWLIYLLPVAVYWIARSFALDSSKASVQQRGIAAVLSTLPRIALLSLRQLTWPRSYSLFYDIPAVPSRVAIFAALVMLSVVVIAFLALRKRSPMLAWVITLVILPVAPWVFALSYLSEYALFQNRYLYLSSVAIAVLIAYGFTRIQLRAVMEPGTESGLRPGIRRTGAAIVLLICVALAAQARQASLPYHDDLALFRHAVEVAPANVLAIALLGDAEGHAGNPDAARELYKKAVSLRPDLWSTQFNLAMVYLREGSQDKAAEALEKAVALPDSNQSQRALAWYEVGMIKASKNDLSGAESALREAERNQPASRRVHAQLVRLLEMEGRHQEMEVEKLKLDGLPARDYSDE